MSRKRRARARKISELRNNAGWVNKIKDVLKQSPSKANPILSEYIALINTTIDEAYGVLHATKATHEAVRYLKKNCEEIIRQNSSLFSVEILSASASPFFKKTFSDCLKAILSDMDKVVDRKKVGITSYTTYGTFRI